MNRRRDRAARRHARDRDCRRGVVAAVVPSEPHVHGHLQILIAIKARCAIVLSPHPAAVRCITRVAELMNEAALKAGALTARSTG